MARNLLGLTQQYAQQKQASPNERLDALLDAWNRGELKVGMNITKAEAENLSAQAFQAGKEFKVQGQPGAKAAFNFADTATFGLLPDAMFKPEMSIGEQYHGAPSSDTWASVGGIVGGSLLGGYGLIKGAGMLGAKGLSAWRSWRNAKDIHKATLVGDDLLRLPARTQTSQASLLNLVNANRGYGGYNRMNPMQYGY